jgi:hypothetical protein
MTANKDYCIVCHESIPIKRHGWFTCSIICSKERQRKGFDPDLLRAIANYIECFSTGAPYNLGISEPKRAMQESPDKTPGVLPLESLEAVLTAEADQQYLESLDKLLSYSRGLS